jgi:peptide-methionine (S)-S-oxide reductase
MGFLRTDKSKLPSADRALPGRAEPIAVAAAHVVSGGPMTAPWPPGARQAMFGLGCFWGAERKFWQLDGVISTQVGYSAGRTRNPTYPEVCSGGTGHNEVVRVIYDPTRVTFDQILHTFWESHDPTQGMGQGNDRGTQYRSGVYTYDESQQAAAEASRLRYGEALAAAGHRPITTEIISADAFYYAEDYHPQ